MLTMSIWLPRDHFLLFEEFAPMAFQDRVIFLPYKVLHLVGIKLRHHPEAVCINL